MSIFNRNLWRACEVEKGKWQGVVKINSAARKRIRQEKGLAFLAQIRAEIAHKFAPEILAEVEAPAYFDEKESERIKKQNATLNAFIENHNGEGIAPKRFKSANRRKTDFKAKGSLPHFYTVGADDAGADLSAANSVGYAMLANATE